MRIARPVIALSALAVLAACQDDAAEPTSAVIRSHPEGFASRGQAGTGWVEGPDGLPMQISYEVQHGRAIMEGDIDLGPVGAIAETPQEVRRTHPLQPRYGVVRDGSSARWAGGVVPYVIDSNVPQQTRITSAISHIESKTGRPDFVPRTNQADYVRVVRSNGCASSVGRVGGVQYVYLADGCSTGNTIHELLHALGMYHEHTRCDRDSFVLINTGNITSGYSGNFTKQCTNATDYHAYNEGSIMHYDPYAFSKNGLPTIVSLRGLDNQMGQRSGMSSVDIATINTIYP